MSTSFSQLFQVSDEIYTGLREALREGQEPINPAALTARILERRPDLSGATDAILAEIRRAAEAAKIPLSEGP